MTTGVEAQLEELREEIAVMHATLDAVNQALVGDLGGRMGLVTRVSLTEQRLVDLEVWKRDRAEALKEMQARVDQLEDWRAEVKNRIIGIGVGLALGSAGIGATVGAIVTSISGG